MEKKNCYGGVFFVVFFSSNSNINLGSPIRRGGGGGKHIDDREMHDIELPADIMVTLMPGLERLVTENRISLDTANQIILLRKVPFELAHNLGLIVPPSGLDLFSSYQQHQQSQSVSPIIGFGNKFGGCGSNSPNLGGHLSGTASPNFTGHFSSSSATNSQNIPGFNPFGGSAGSGNGCGSPANGSILTGIGSGGCGPSFSGSSSPSAYYGAGGTSPMHQITKGISGLTTGGGSITRGTSAACDTSSINNQPLDLSMDIGGCGGTTYNEPQQTGTYSGGWYVPAQFYDLKPLNLSPAQQVVRIVPTPPASPNLCIIQEENSNAQHHQSQTAVSNEQEITSSTILMNTNEDANFPHSHPQICLTDVQGSEITLVALSDATISSRDSDDSLEGHSSITLQGLIIADQPHNNGIEMPSIMKGVGRKLSLEIEHIKQQEHYERRGSDKSLGFSDDSLSNDSNILSPSQEPSASSGFKSGGDSHSDTCCDHTESRLSPDSLSESRCISSTAAPDEYYEVPLPHECSNLDSTRILEMVKQTIDSKMPPKGFVLHKVINDSALDQAYGGIGGGGVGITGGGSICVTTSSSSNNTNDMQFSAASSMDISNLSLEYSGGLQIELQVCDGKSKNNSASKGIKLRRISGDQFEYGKLCQQLISSLTV